MSRNRILLVDDEPRLRKMVKDFLKRADYDVIEAENGRQAVDIFFSDTKIDLIILDVMMPEMNGWEVCRTIRKESTVPIIMLNSANSGKESTVAIIFGIMRYEAEFTPIISSASICSVMRIVPISEAIFEPTLPAKIIAITVDENSKNIVSRVA